MATIRENFEKREAIPPNYDQLLFGVHKLGYGDPVIEIGDLLRQRWHCTSCDANGWFLSGVTKTTCDQCAEESLEVSDEEEIPVAQVYLAGNPLRQAVAAMCAIPKDRVTEGGFEGLEPVSRQHLAICSALAEAFTLACQPEALRAQGQN